MHELDTHDETLLTVQEVSRWIRVAPDTVRRWATRGTIPALRVGGRVLFSHAAILAWLRARARPDQAILGQDTPRSRFDELQQANSRRQWR